MRVWLGAISLGVTVIVAASGQQLQLAEGKGMIVGRVIDAASGAPLSGVAVSTTTRAGQQTVVTDAQGRFLLVALPKGTYTVTATTGGNGFSPSGFIVSGFGHQIGPYLNGGYGQRRPRGPLAPIDLGEGERVSDAVIRLWKGGAINGRVVDEAGEPLVDVVVAAVARTSDGRLLNGPTTRTDDRGIYRVGTLAPGEYVVVVPQTQFVLPASTVEAVVSAPLDPNIGARFGNSSAPPPPRAATLDMPSPELGVRMGASFLTQPAPMRVTNTLIAGEADGRRYVYQTTFHPSANAAARATVVRTRSGEERQDVDVQLTPVPAAEVSGVLTDSSGPVADFGVHLVPDDATDGGATLAVASAATNASGAFHFPLVPAGAYKLLAVRTGGDAPGSWAAQPIAVTGDNVSNVILTLRPGISVSGRVEFVGAGEKPSADVLRKQAVTLARAEPLFRSPPISAPRPIEASLEFALPRVMPGRYVVTVRDMPPWSVQSVTVGGHDVTDAVMALDRDLKDVLVTFTDRPSSVTGTVAAASGTTNAADASIFLFPADRARWPDAQVTSRAFRTVRVTGQGTFSIPNVIPGEYFVVAASDDLAGDWPDPRLLAKLEGVATRVRVEASQTAALTLRVVDIR